MKKLILILMMVMPVFLVTAQENNIIINGGYVFTNIEDTDASGSGWRIDGIYEFQPIGSKFSYGLSIGYLSVTASESGNDYTINTLPISFVPKYYFKEEGLRPYLKGVLGFQFSDLRREGTLTTIEANDSGLIFGVGAGVKYGISEKVFLNFEYEFAYTANSFYRDGLMNSLTAGLGFRF